MNVETELPQADRTLALRAIPNIPLIDKRSDVPPTEKKRLNRVTERVFQQIKNVERCRIALPIDEVSIAKTMDEQKKLISERKKTLAHAKRQTPTAMNDTFNADSEIQEAQQQLDELKKQKNGFLQSDMAEYLTAEHGSTLKATIREIIFAIHEEIFRRGDDIYTQDALTTLIYELVYDAFLWRGRKRKDGVTPIFFSHLKEAVLEHIDHGFFTMPRILSALKHDDIEDLPMHRDGPKWDWLYCSDLYVHHFNTETSERYPKPPKVYLAEIMANTRTTIMAATNPFMEDSPTELSNNHYEKDEQKLIRFYEHLLQHGYLGVLKILEQIQNAKTIIALGAERAGEKLALMLRHYAMLAKILELKKAYRDLVGAGIDFYHPELRRAYNERQKQQILRHLGLDRADTEKTLPESLLKKKPSKNTGENINDMVRQFLDDTDEYVDSEKVEAVQRKIRKSIQAVFAPIHPRIISMEIVPTPLEDYVDIVRLIKDRDYIPKISAEDPLFEVVILVKSPDDMQKVIREIAQKIPHTHGLEELPSIDMPNYPQTGNTIHLKDPSFGGKVHIRINTVHHEILAQRGVYANHNIPLPEPLRSQLRQALGDARLYQLPIIETVKERVLIDNIVVFTDEKKRQGFCLPERACVLDLAAALPERLGVQTFLHAQGATNATGETLNTIATLQHQGYYHIETAPQNTTLDVGHLPFCVSARYHQVLKKHFKTIPPEKRKRESLTRSNQYIQKLNDLFGINDPEIILRLSTDIAKEQPENLLHRIGEGNFDPLRVLSRYVNRSCHTNTEFILENKPGVLQMITEETSKYDINITSINQKSTGDDGKTAFLSITCDFPPWLPQYEILKLFLRFTYMPEVQKVRVDSNKSGLFKFPPHI